MNTLKEVFQQFRPGLMCVCSMRASAARNATIAIDDENRTVVFGNSDGAAEIFCTESELPLDTDILLGRFWGIMDRIVGKSYGQIAFEAKQAYYAENGTGAITVKCDWNENPTPLAKAAFEAAAQAVIAAYKASLEGKSE